MAKTKRSYNRIDDNHNVMRNGSGYSAERAHKGRVVVGWGRTIEDAIEDCEAKARGK